MILKFNETNRLRGLDAAERTGFSLFNLTALGSALALMVAIFSIPLTAVASDALIPEPYLPDSTYSSGLYKHDGFAGSASKSYAGKKIVRLDNDDVIVAGIVPPQTSGTNVVNLGLVRYNSAGQRVAWTDPGVYGFNAGQYVVYRNTNDPVGFDNVRDVSDMKVLGNRKYVMVDHNYDTLGDVDSYVSEFNTTDTFLHRTAALESTDPNAGQSLLSATGMRLGQGWP